MRKLKNEELKRITGGYGTLYVRNAYQAGAKPGPANIIKLIREFKLPGPEQVAGR